MNRTHISASNQPIKLRETEICKENCFGDSIKPCGFWYEVDGDWLRWCKGEGWNIDALRFLFEVDLVDCNILFVNTLRKLDAFHEEYYKVRPGQSWSGYIDWKSVSQKYDGLEIAPYQYKRRFSLDFLWYYGWDCASGVIWRPRNATVTYVRKLDEGEIPEESERASL